MLPCKCLVDALPYSHYAMRSCSLCGVRVFSAQHDLGGGGVAYSFVACLSHLTIDHAPLSRRRTVRTPNRDASNVWALITLCPYITQKLCAYPIPVLFRRLWPPPVSQYSDRFLATLVYQTPPCHIRRISSPPPLTRPVPHCIFHILLPCESYSNVVPHGRICAPMSSRLLGYLFLLSGRSRSATRNRTFVFFA